MPEQFKIIPILGRNTTVPQDDISLFLPLSEKVAYTHDVGGLNFDLSSKKNACAKSYGYSQWSNSANASHTKCLGLFELISESNRDYVYFDNGKCYVFDGAVDPILTEDTASTTFANDNNDLYSTIRIGEYFTFADHGETTPYKWKHGDANLTTLVGATGGTAFKFRYLESFQRRVIGCYSDQTDGDIDLRWTTSWPTTAINHADFGFPAANQLYMPNDDSITGIKKMGEDRCFVYNRNSIHQLIYYPDYSAPFRLRNIIPDFGCAGHHSIVSLGDRHYLFNAQYGFVEYRGGHSFPYEKPISEAIENDIGTINSNYYELIVGTYIPLTHEICWTVPVNSATTPNRLFFYNISTKQWRFEDKSMKYIDNWLPYATMTWNDLIDALGGAGATWEDAGSDSWAKYTSAIQKLVYGNTDGHLYTHETESLNGSAIDSYRIEPILDFGSKYNYKLLTEIWFDIGLSGAYSIDLYLRGGNTVGEVVAAAWENVGLISLDNSNRPMLNVGKNHRLHQLKWGTDGTNEPYEINGITFVYEIGEPV